MLIELKFEETVFFGFIGIPKAVAYFRSTNSRFFHIVVLHADHHVNTQLAKKCLSFLWFLLLFITEVLGKLCIFKMTGFFSVIRDTL